LRHDVLKRFKGASLYKRERDTSIKNITVAMPRSVSHLSDKKYQSGDTLQWWYPSVPHLFDKNMNEGMPFTARYSSSAKKKDLPL
jgi:hypothetical protein